MSDCVHAALSAAEKNAGERIEGVYLSCSGGHIDGFSSRGAANVTAADNHVSPQDLQRACDNAKNKDLPADRIYIHHVRSSCQLDNQPVDDPIGMTGSQLEVSYWHVSGEEGKVRNLISVINGYGLNVDDLILGGFASSCLSAREEEKRNGVLVVDIGGGTTDYVLYRGGAVQCSGVIPVGGDHLTNDLSIGLRINARAAESLKLKFGHAVYDSDQRNHVFLHGDLSIGDRAIPQRSINRILNLRVEEIFSIIANRLGSRANAQNLPAGVVLTGGTSRLPGMSEAVRHVLGVDARLAEVPSWVSDSELRQPEYSNVVGLLYYGLQAHRDQPAKPSNTGIISRVLQMIHGD